MLNRFREDWTNDKINKEKVMIVHFDSIMNDFESLMNQILLFIGKEMTDELQKTIKHTAENQKVYKSGHKYNLAKFGLTEKKIKEDCKGIYDTFQP